MHSQPHVPGWQHNQCLVFTPLLSLTSWEGTPLLSAVLLRQRLARVVYQICLYQNLSHPLQFGAPYGRLCKLNVQFEIIKSTYYGVFHWVVQKTTPIVAFLVAIS